MLVQQQDALLAPLPAQSAVLAFHSYPLLVAYPFVKDLTRDEAGLFGFKHCLISLVMPGYAEV